MSEHNRLGIEIPSFAKGAMIPASFAFGVAHPEKKCIFSANRNPHIEWFNVPENTKSLVLLMVDYDAPIDLSIANKSEQTIPIDTPRNLFYHWVLVNIPPQIHEIPAGSVSDGVEVHGKQAGMSPYGMVGLNDYTSWFSEDVDMQGSYAGYDGPCPPWNDKKIHRYGFQIYALDCQLYFQGDFTGYQAKAAMIGHIIDQDEWVATYCINQSLWEPSAS